jgi:hypothetical protein
MPTPNGVFLDRPRYMNFTHAIRIHVVIHGEDNMLTLSIQAFLRATSTSMGEGIPTTLHTNKVQKLFRLHEAYWSGLRYNVHSLQVYGGDDVDTSPNNADDTPTDTPKALS